MEQLDIPIGPGPDLPHPEIPGMGEQALERAARVASAARHIAHDLQIVKLTSPDDNPGLAEQIARFRWQEFDHVPDPSSGRVERRVNSMRDRTTIAAVAATGEIQAIGIQEIDRANGTAHIEEVVTAAESRGQGLGQAVMVALVNEAKSEGVTTVSLSPVDRQAEAFFENLGFQSATSTTHTKKI